MKPYRMVGDSLVPEEDFTAAGLRLGDVYGRIVAVTFLPQTDGAGDPIEERVKVSTVFLVFDHGSRGGGPVLFETMIFNGPLDGSQERYASYWDAYYGHRRWVDRALGALDPDDRMSKSSSVQKPIRADGKGPAAP